MASNDVIGFSDPAVTGITKNYVNRWIARAERRKARNYEMQLSIEAQALTLARDKGFAGSVYRDYKRCPDLRAKASFAKVLAEIARLGKREPEKAETAQQTNIQINIVAPLTAEQLMEMIPEVPAKVEAKK